LGSICVLIHSCKMRKKVRRRDLIVDESGGWLVTRRMSTFLTVMPLRELSHMPHGITQCYQPYPAKVTFSLREATRTSRPFHEVRVAEVLQQALPAPPPGRAGASDVDHYTPESRGRGRGLDPLSSLIQTHPGRARSGSTQAGQDLAGGRPAAQLNCGSLDGRL